MKRALALAFLLATTLNGEERHAAIRCEPNGIEFTCTAYNIEGVDGTPTWTLYATPEYVAYGLVVTERAPAHWTLLRFRLKDRNNDITLKVIVRQHKGKVEFAASDDEVQHVEKDNQ